MLHQNLNIMQKAWISLAKLNRTHKYVLAAIYQPLHVCQCVNLYCPDIINGPIQMLRTWTNHSFHNVTWHIPADKICVTTQRRYKTLYIHCRMLQISKYPLSHVPLSAEPGRILVREPSLGSPFNTIYYYYCVLPYDSGILGLQGLFVGYVWHTEF